MKKYLFLVTLLVPAITLAEWVKVTSASAGEVTVYVDPATIARTGNVVEFSTLFDYTTIKTMSDASFSSATMRDEIDCVGKRVRTLAVSSHSEAMAGGYVVSTSTGYVPWTPIAPKSIVSKILKYVCTKGRPTAGKAGP